MRIRAARPEDVATVHGFIRELAEYERAPDQVTGTVEMLHGSLFGERPTAEALLAVDEHDAPLGFAIFFGTFSTWECRPGIWLEDLYVTERARRSGVGGALLRALAGIALERGCARLEWTALDWNEPALAFYAGIGSTRMEEWTTHRLTGEALRQLAAGGPAAGTGGKPVPRTGEEPAPGTGGKPAPRDGQAPGPGAT